MKNLPSVWKSSPFYRSTLDDLMDTSFVDKIDRIWDLALDESFNWAGVSQKTNGDNHLISIDVPGFKKDEINVKYENDMVFVSGETKDKTRSLKKYFSVPSYIVTSEIPEAKLEDGVLQISFKIDNKKEKSGKIEIK